MFEICFALVFLFLASAILSFTIRKISKKFGHTQEHIAELPKNLDVASSYNFNNWAEWSCLLCSFLIYKVIIPHKLSFVAFWGKKIMPWLKYNHQICINEEPMPVDQHRLKYLIDKYQSSLWITSPERNLGSNQVVFGGIILPVSAISISCFIDTG